MERIKTKTIKLVGMNYMHDFARAQGMIIDFMLKWADKKTGRYNGVGYGWDDRTYFYVYQTKTMIVCRKCEDRAFEKSEECLIYLQKEV